MKLNTTIKTLCAAVAIAASAAASAGQVWMDIGADYGNNGTGAAYVNDTSTGIKNQLNIDYTSTTILNLQNGSFTTTFGWDQSTLTSLAGNGITGGNNVASFDPTSGSNGYGIDNSWFMTFKGNAAGTFSFDSNGKAILSYNSGTINLFASENPYNLATYSNFMTIGITGGLMSPGNSNLTGKVTSTTGAYADLFNSVFKPSCAAGNTFTQILACGDEAPIWFTGNFNTYDPTFIPGNFVETPNGPVPTTLSATGEHNGSVKFDVPEPASLALLGVGLFGLGAVRRRKIAA